METRRRKKKIRAAVDPVEANALRGGRMSFRDSVVVTLQTLISNSAGASVGLEAGYAQIGAAFGSALGQKLRLRRNDLRLLVGAGAGAAIAGAFNAPLTGAFYAFEVVLGAYSISGAAPIFTAAIAGTLTTKLIATAPYQIETPALQALTWSSYVALIGLAALTSALGILAMRAAGLAEKALEATRLPPLFRPVIGAVIVASLAIFTPQVLGAGPWRARAGRGDEFSRRHPPGFPGHEARRLPGVAGERLSRRPVLRLAADGRAAGKDLRARPGGTVRQRSRPTPPCASSPAWRRSGR